MKDDEKIAVRQIGNDDRKCPKAALITIQEKGKYEGGERGGE